MYKQQNKYNNDLYEKYIQEILFVFIKNAERLTTHKDITVSHTINGCPSNPLILLIFVKTILF